MLSTLPVSLQLELLEKMRDAQFAGGAGRAARGAAPWLRHAEWAHQLSGSGSCGRITYLGCSWGWLERRCMPIPDKAGRPGQSCAPVPRARSSNITHSSSVCVARARGTGVCVAVLWLLGLQPKTILRSTHPILSRAVPCRAAPCSQPREVPGGGAESEGSS